jgi:hypothetical protein
MPAFETVFHRAASVSHAIKSHAKPSFFTALLAAGVLMSVPAMTVTASASDWVSPQQMRLFERNQETGNAVETRDRVRTRAGIGRQPLGRAPYLCTPSGFGRTATCYLRGSVSRSIN